MQELQYSQESRNRKLLPEKTFIEAEKEAKALSLVYSFLEEQHSLIASHSYSQRHLFSVSAPIGGITPLYLACEKGNPEIVKALLDLGANPRIKNDLHTLYTGFNNIGLHPNNAPPMQAALMHGDVDLVKLLMDHGAPFDEKDEDGRTFLFHTVHAKHEKLALFFIENGAKTSLTDNYGISLVSMAVRTVLFEVVKKLVEKGEPVNGPCQVGLTPLYLAVGRKHSKLVEFLLQNGAITDINFRFCDKWTPLSEAVSSGNLENVKLLVEAGADLSIEYREEGSDKMGIFDYAKHKNQQHIVDYLLGLPEYSHLKSEGDSGSRNENFIVNFF